MEFESSFTVTAPVEQVWDTLLDVERVAPCMPGAQVLERTGEDAFKVAVKVKLGPMSMLYRGDVEIVERDAEKRVATMRARARESRGQGTAQADVHMTLGEQGSKTQATIRTDMKVSGKAAAMGSGVIKDVANVLLQTFAENLQKMIAGGGAAREAPAAAGKETPAKAAEGGATEGAAAGGGAAGEAAEAGGGAAGEAAEAGGGAAGKGAEAGRGVADKTATAAAEKTGATNGATAGPAPAASAEDAPGPGAAPAPEPLRSAAADASLPVGKIVLGTLRARLQDPGSRKAIVAGIAGLALLLGLRRRS